MVTTMPIHTTAIVESLARSRPDAPSVFGRLLQWVPRKTTPPAPAAKHTQSPHPVARVKPAAFTIYVRHAVPRVYPPAAVGIGLRAGTWISVRLRHGVADTDPALVVLHVTRPIQGQTGSLPPGTRLLTRVESVSGHRLGLSVSAAVTPDNRLIPLKGQVFDARFHFGLPAFVVGGRRAAALVAFGQSFLASADAALGLMGAQGSLASAAIGSAGQRTLGATMHWRLTRYALYAPAQNAYVQTQSGS